MIVRSSRALLTGGIDVHVHLDAVDLRSVQLDPIERRVVFDPIESPADLLLALELLARRLGEQAELVVDSTPQLDRAELVVDAARAAVPPAEVIRAPFGRPPLEPADAPAAGAEIGFCCNHHCPRFEYRVAVVGDVEAAVCTECTWRLVHESGLTWADAAAAGYRQSQQHTVEADRPDDTDRKGH